MVEFWHNFAVQDAEEIIVRRFPIADLLSEQDATIFCRVDVWWRVEMLQNALEKEESCAPYWLASDVGAPKLPAEHIRSLLFPSTDEGINPWTTLLFAYWLM